MYSKEIAKIAYALEKLTNNSKNGSLDLFISKMKTEFSMDITLTELNMARRDLNGFNKQWWSERESILKSYEVYIDDSDFITKINELQANLGIDESKAGKFDMVEEEAKIIDEDESTVIEDDAFTLIDDSDEEIDPMEIKRDAWGNLYTEGGRMWDRYVNRNNNNEDDY